MIICDEMKKLREELNRIGIGWEDVSMDNSDADINWWICRTHFYYGKYHVSVINGCGTYGGFYFYDENENEGLLEMLVDGPENIPIGHLTAENVLKILNDIANVFRYKSLSEIERLILGQNTR